MTEQPHAVRMTSLDRAIETVTHDLRVPKKLRTALAVYQKQRDDQETETTGLPKKTESSITVVSKRCNPKNAAQKGSCILNWPIAVEHEISFRYNDESLDWSVKINGQRHEHVTSEVMEALVECALIVVRYTGAPCRRCSLAAAAYFAE
jgi:hypothetical protein